MRLFTITAVCASLFLPLTALAVPPREANKRPMGNTAQRPAANAQRPGAPGGTPSLSPAGRPGGKPNQPGGGNSGGTPNWMANSGGNKRPPSILPTTPNYLPSGRNPGGRNPGGNNPGGVVVNPGGRNPGTSRPPSSRYTPHDVNAYNRPANNRPDVVINRPDININRPTINRPQINSNNTVNNINTTVINNNIVNNNQNFGNQNFVNRPNNNYQNNYRPPRPYYSQLHYHWQPSSWSAAYRPAYYNYSYSSVSGTWLGVGGGGLAYVNPFYVRPAATTVVRYDYSQPIRVPEPNYQETQDDLIRSERAIRRFDDAREVFRRGEYGRAGELIDEAIELLPSDPTLHQFRSLILFARGRYQEAAATLYSVLAVSSGWDRDTLLKLYDTPERYLAQVADLERFAVANPTAIESRFLLAYHYLYKGDVPAAQRQLEIVRVAKPNDRVVETLLSALQGQTPG